MRHPWRLRHPKCDPRLHGPKIRTFPGRPFWAWLHGSCFEMFRDQTSAFGGFRGGGEGDDFFMIWLWHFLLYRKMWPSVSRSLQWRCQIWPSWTFEVHCASRWCTFPSTRSGPRVGQILDYRTAVFILERLSWSLNWPKSSEESLDSSVN
jgi:hypothetical protein